MSDKHLSLSPHRLDEFAWWYEQPKGLCIVIEVRKPDGQHVSTEMRTIRWSSLKMAIARKERKP